MDLKITNQKGLKRIGHIHAHFISCLYVSLVKCVPLLSNNNWIDPHKMRGLGFLAA